MMVSDGHDLWLEEVDAAGKKYLFSFPQNTSDKVFYIPGSRGGGLMAREGWCTKPPTNY